VLKETQQPQRAGAATAAGGEGGGGESETVVLVKQFRPPINAYTVELPAVSGSSFRSSGEPGPHSLGQCS
jgi:hypothetical protein